MEKHTAEGIKILLRFALVTAAALLLTGLLRTVVAANQTTVALAFLMLVLVTASRWPLAYSVFASVLCTVLYNFFFLPPVGRLTIQDPRNWVALVAFLCSGVLVSHLAERERLHLEDSEARRLEVERLYEFSQQLLLQQDLRDLRSATPSLVAKVFGLHGVALYVRGEDTVYSSDPGKELVPAVDLKLAADQGEARPVLRDGLCIIPLALGMKPLGVLAVTDAGYSPQIYEAIGGLIAIALERASALERSSRLEASRNSERLRSALLDSITHDLRTPLTAIRAAATTLVSNPDLPEAERAELSVVVDEESARLDRMIGQAVQMAQLDADALQIRARPQDVAELVESVVREMRPLLSGRFVQTQIPESLPLVPMDGPLIHRVLRHLIENAIKYSPPQAAIQINAACDEYRLLIAVADRGPGVEPEEQLLVFDKFFRGKDQRGRASGTGMGLAIAKSIVEAHHGGISVAGRSGGGAEFTFWLPLVPVAQPALPAAAQSATA